MGLKLGVFGFFLVIKITVVHHQVCMSLHPLWSDCEDKTHVKCHMVCKDRGHIGIEFVFVCVVGEDPKTPKMSLAADGAITRDGIEV